MHQNQIRLNPQIAELSDPPVDALKMLRVQPVIIKTIIHLRRLRPRIVFPLTLCLFRQRPVKTLSIPALIRICQRLAAVKFIIFRINTKTYLVKRRGREGL